MPFNYFHRPGIESTHKPRNKFLWLITTNCLTRMISKTRTSEIKECNECSCGDFTHLLAGKYNCGHLDAQYSTPDNTHMMLSLVSVVILLYPEMGHVSPVTHQRSGAARTKKSSITEIMPCTASPEGCVYYGYNNINHIMSFLSHTSEPQCVWGHGPAAHQQTKALYLHLYFGILVEWLYENLGHLDGDGYKKRRLSQIAECENINARISTSRTRSPLWINSCVSVGAPGTGIRSCIGRAGRRCGTLFTW
jgi:hypothetical protein